MNLWRRGARKGVAYSVGFIILFGGATLVYAFNSYLNSFNATYGTAATPLNTCGVCHVDPGGGGTLTGYGDDLLTSGINFASIENLDSDGDGFSNITEIRALTNPGNAASHPATADTTPPTVTAFAVPATGTSLNVAVTTFTATDNVGVTGYRITETSAVPAATTTGWTASAPTTYALSTAGAKTLYAWAKDAAGNVSAGVSATTTVALTDTTAPVVTAFTIPTTLDSLVVPIATFTATDNVAVTGYLVTESATAPGPGPDAGWSATLPTRYTFSSAGSKTLYAWAKDAAGNVSLAVSASVTIAQLDTVPPAVTGFTIPAGSTSLTVSITTFTATDNVAVTGYLVTESATAPGPGPAAGWSASSPTTYTFNSDGSKTLYAWAKDAAGNVSAGVSATTSVNGAAVALSDEEGGGGGRCFIATAAFGSYINPYVRILRSFRDTFLLTNSPGRVFVEWYYRVSPPWAERIGQSSVARSFVRAGLIPLIGFSSLALAIGFLPSLCIAFLSLTLLWVGAKKILILRHQSRV